MGTSPGPVAFSAWDRSSLGHSGLLGSHSRSFHWGSEVFGDSLGSHLGEGGFGRWVSGGPSFPGFRGSFDEWVVAFEVSHVVFPFTFPVTLGGSTFGGGWSNVFFDDAELPKGGRVFVSGDEFVGPVVFDGLDGFLKDLEIGGPGCLSFHICASHEGQQTESTKDEANKDRCKRRRPSSILG